MPRRISSIVGAALAVLVVASSAATVGARTSSGTGTSASAAPFAEAWASVPRTSAGKAKSVLVFGAEQDIVGFNGALTCCNQFWAAVQVVPVIRGTYNVDNRLRHILDLVSAAKA